ncbi:DUF2163 domain-containing protein [Nitratireductor sp. B36]|uniref:DUF2163 domain-containing protein n=1 Tax=Nitratireductor sp. B36 TaxID=2762059 RepID=UPI001E353DA1|nr:DUF2163 domain-containing protein [Nitratireductor sp. B36]MCC5778166.1 DUF2163 domain-containing protein [Nitratireductor sp. B36]
MTSTEETLEAHIQGEVTSLCHCWRLSRSDGIFLGFTDHDRQLHCDGTSFHPNTGFTASEARSSFGLSVDTVDVVGALSASEILEDDILSGLYDGARVETLLVNWRNPSTFHKLRVAVIGKVTRQDGRFVAELESEAWTLDQPSGRTVGRCCDAELGDQRCGVDLTDDRFAGSGTFLRAEEGNVVVVDGLDAFAAGWFDNGVLTWASGAQSGRKERVIAHAKSGSETRLSLWREAPLSGEAGDLFTVVSGCDKQFSTCKGKFQNALNFRGFPHLPGDDAAYSYVRGEGVFDGKALVR